MRGSVAGSRTIGGSQAVKGSQALKRTDRNNVAVRNDAGADVTPLSLLLLRKTLKSQDGSVASLESAARENVLDILDDMEKTGTVFGLASKSTHTVEGSAHSQRGSISHSHSMVETAESAENSIAAGSIESERLSVVGVELSSDRTSTHKKYTPTTAKKSLNESRLVHIYIRETAIMPLFELVSISVPTDSLEECILVKAQNAKYKELKAIHANNDNYVSKAMQTVNPTQKVKDVQATNVKFTDQAVNTTAWEIYDAFVDMDTAGDAGAREIELDNIAMTAVAQSGSVKNSQFTVRSQSAATRSSIYGGNEDNATNSVTSAGGGGSRIQLPNISSNASTGLYKEAEKDDLLKTVILSLM